VAGAIAGALETLARERPRGALPTSAGAQQVQWRGVAAARGALLEGDGYAVSHEADGALRIGPGYRNVAVLERASEDDVLATLRPLGVHLKCVGVAGDEAVRDALARRLTDGIAPRVCAIGAMQTPGVDAPADGERPHAGLVRYVGLT
jgi:hypothetical protein